MPTLSKSRSEGLGGRKDSGRQPFPLVPAVAGTLFMLGGAYAELACHYGTPIDPARVAKPKDKGNASDCTPFRC